MRRRKSKARCLVGDTDEAFERHEQQKCNHALRWAGHRFAQYIGQIVQDMQSEDCECYNFEPVSAQAAKANGLPNVALVLQPQSQMEALGYNDLWYGWDLNKFLPSFVSPTEVLDGAMISGSFMPSTSKWSTYDMQNFPTIRELFAEHGKSLNFIGVILSMLNVALEQKERAAIMVVNIAKNIGAEYAIVTEEGYGNPDADYVRCQVALEDAGIPVVGISNECTGRDGFSQPLMTLDSKMNALVSTGNVVLEQYPLGTLISALMFVLICTFFVTSANSATYVLGMYSEAGALSPSNTSKVVWGLLMAALAAVMMLSGENGLNMLQILSIVAAFPFAFIMLASIASLLKALKSEKL